MNYNETKKRLNNFISNIPENYVKNVIKKAEEIVLEYIDTGVTPSIPTGGIPIDLSFDDILNTP